MLTDASPSTLHDRETLMSLHTVQLQTLKPMAFVLQEHYGNVGMAHWLEALEMSRMMAPGFDFKTLEKGRDLVGLPEDEIIKLPSYGGSTRYRKPVYYRENLPAQYAGNFYQAAATAYNSHGEWVLSPDDVWLAISLWFTKFVGDHAEVLRPRFVDHEGKKKLVIVVGEEEPDRWGCFFERIPAAIQAYTKPGVVETLTGNFTTSTSFERVLNAGVIMNTLKHYFEYGCAVPGCGLTAVHFLGSEEDWAQLITKLEALLAFDHAGKVKAYVDGLKPVLLQFLQTYRGHPDVDWWNHIMDERSGRLGSGGTTYVSGWFLRFYGLSGEIDVGKLHHDNIEVDIELNIAGAKQTLCLMGGFDGLHVDGRKVRPVSSLAIMHKPDQKIHVKLPVASRR